MEEDLGVVPLGGARVKPVWFRNSGVVPVRWSAQVSRHLSAQELAQQRENKRARRRRNSTDWDSGTGTDSDESSREELGSDSDDDDDDDDGGDGGDGSSGRRGRVCAPNDGVCEVFPLSGTLAPGATQVCCRCCVRESEPNLRCTFHARHLCPPSPALARW